MSESDPKPEIIVKKVDRFMTGESFVMVSGPFLMDPSLTDAERVYLVALESWAWEKDHCYPGNSEIAQRCGWMKDGKPSRDKAQRIGQGLEAKGRIRRVVTVVDGRHHRDRIEILGTRSAHKLPPTADLPQGTAELTHPTAKTPHGYGDNAAGVRQESGRGTANLPPELDSGIDPGNQTHLPQTPPQGRGEVEWAGLPPSREEHVSPEVAVAELMEVLRSVSERGPSLDRSDLERFALELESVMGYQPGCIGHAGSGRAIGGQARWNMHLGFCESTANGFSLKQVEASLHKSMELEKRYSHYPGCKFRRQNLHKMLWEIRSKAAEWRGDRMRAGRFRSILPRVNGRLSLAVPAEWNLHTSPRTADASADDSLARSAPG